MDATLRTLLVVISGMHLGACAAAVGPSGSADAIREVIQRTEAMNNAGDWAFARACVTGRGTSVNGGESVPST